MKEILIQIIAAFVATAGFATVFQCPFRLIPFAGFTGVVSWVAFYFLKPVIGLGFSMFTASLLLSVVGRVFSARYRCPLTVFLVSGIIPLVPGSGVFLTVFHLLQRNLSGSIRNGIESFMTCGAILLGISLISMIPQKFFGFARKKTV